MVCRAPTRTGTEPAALVNVAERISARSLKMSARRVHAMSPGYMKACYVPGLYEGIAGACACCSFSRPRTDARTLGSWRNRPSDLGFAATPSCSVIRQYMCSHAVLTIFCASAWLCPRVLVLAVSLRPGCNSSATGTTPAQDPLEIPRVAIRSEVIRDHSVCPKPIPWVCPRVLASWCASRP